MKMLIMNEPILKSEAFVLISGSYLHVDHTLERREREHCMIMLYFETKIESLNL